MRVSVEMYQRMISAGVLTRKARVELIEGEILEMAPIGTRRAAFVARLHELLAAAVAKRAIVTSAGAVVLGAWSEPGPDLMLLRPRTDYYAAAHPGAADVLLLVEVSDSSLVFDGSRKRLLYARYGIDEYWIVNLPERMLEVYRTPSAQGYAERLELRTGESAAPQAVPEVQIALSDLFEIDSNVNQ